MTQYKGIVKTRTPERKILLVVVGCIILYLSFEMRNWLYITMAVILLFAVFFTKEHIVDEKGVHIVYNFLGIKIPYSWGWDVITAIRPDYDKAKPNVLLEIGKDVTIRAFVFTKEDALEVMKFAKEMKPDLYVDDVTEEEYRKREADRKAKMAYAKERQKKSKKKK